jgi:hypothetical protein
MVEAVDPLCLLEINLPEAVQKVLLRQGLPGQGPWSPSEPDLHVVGKNGSGTVERNNAPCYTQRLEGNRIVLAANHRCTPAGTSGGVLVSKHNEIVGIYSGAFFVAIQPLIRGVNHDITGFVPWLAGQTGPRWTRFLAPAVVIAVGGLAFATSFPLMSASDQRYDDLESGRSSDRAADQAEGKRFAVAGYSTRWAGAIGAALGTGWLFLRW